MHRPQQAQRQLPGGCAVQLQERVVDPCTFRATHYYTTASLKYWRPLIVQWLHMIETNQRKAYRPERPRWAPDSVYPLLLYLKPAPSPEHAVCMLLPCRIIGVAPRPACTA